VLPPYVAFAVRMNPGIWEYVKVHSEDLSVEGITPSEYLKFKETLYDEKWYTHFFLSSPMYIIRAFTLTASWEHVSEFSGPRMTTRWKLISVLLTFRRLV
jgi:hypothetical protein